LQQISKYFGKMNFQRFISRISNARKQSPIRLTTKIAQDNPHFINMASGMPNSCKFPFDQIEMTLKDGKQLSLSGINMERALQYSPTPGISSLLDWIYKIHEKYHNPPLMKSDSNRFEAVVTTGSQDGLMKIFEMLISPGDNILMDNPCYSGTLAAVGPMPCNKLPVETDGCGLIPSSLQKVLSKWHPDESLDSSSSIPKVLYTIPNGSNPTGASTSESRKKEIFEIARLYDIVIIEDDPYYFIQFEDSIPSYQSMDTEGRVIRTDSFSKILSSGMRLGWVSGAKAFIERIVLHQQASTLHTSTLTQMMASSLLDYWKLEGFDSHVENVKLLYQSQRDIMSKSLKKHLKDLAEWDEPKGGMFFWIKLNGVSDTTKLINEKAFKEEIIMLPGKVFEVDSNVTNSSYIRASYSTVSEENMDKAFEKLAVILKNL